METRPKLKLQLTLTDKILEVLGYSLLMTYYIWNAVCYVNLPDIIPSHFSIKGEIDGFGHKSFILWLPIVAIVLFAGMTILSKYPHRFNYPVKITSDNALKQYTNMTRLVRILKLVVVVVFFLISFMLVQIPNKEPNQLRIWFLPLVLGITFLPIIYLISKSFKNN